MQALMIELSMEKVKRPELSEFIDRFLKTTRNFWPGLFVYYEHPELRSTNNDMERFLREAKGQYRRMTGRRNWNDYILRYGPYIVFHDSNEDESEIFMRFALADRGALEKTKKELERNWRWRRNQIAFRRNPGEYLKRIERNGKD